MAHITDHCRHFPGWTPMTATLSGHFPYDLGFYSSPTPRPQFYRDQKHEALLLFVDFVLFMQLQLGDVIPGQASTFLGQVFE